MYSLHIGNKNYSSWSLRPWVLLKELKIPFEEKLHIFFTDDWQEYVKFNPSGLVPLLVNDDQTQVWDSLAIMEFLAERHKGVWPEDDAARTWARCAAAEMHSGFFVLRDVCSMSCGVRVELSQENKNSAVLNKDISRIDALWQQGLEKFGGPFLAGDTFTAVDAMYAPVAFRFQTFGIELSEASAAYRDHILGLDSLKEWYESALTETARDELHEGDITRHGTIVSDFRASE